MNTGISTQSITEYASSNAGYLRQPTQAQQARGVIPRDSLPAQWWNYYNNAYTKNSSATVDDLTNIRTELINVISNAEYGGNLPSDANSSQLVEALETRVSRIADTLKTGVVKSDAVTDGGISVDSSGKMSVNGWSTVKNAIGDITAVAATDVASLADAIGSLDNPGINYQGTYAWNPGAGRTSLVDQINFILTQISGAVVGIGVITQSSTESPVKDTRYIVKNGATLTLATPGVDYQRIEVIAYGAACTLVFPDPSGTSKTLQMIADSSIELYTKLGTGYITGVYGALWN